MLHRLMPLMPSMRIIRSGGNGSDHVHWPVLFFRNHAADGIESTTLNLSSTGFFCFSQTPFVAGESLFCTLRIPAHDPEGKERLWILECRARVKRAEPVAPEGLFGVACEFEDYRLLSSHSVLSFGKARNTAQTT